MNESDQRELSRQDHWDSRYAGAREDGLAEHEWFRTFKEIEGFLLRHIPKASDGQQPKILHLGCGTSDVTKGLYDLGYTNQCNIDFSPVAIASMKERHADMRGVTWEVMDVRNMQIEDCTIDLAFDKGTLDAMLWGSLWNPDDEIKQNVGRYVDEVARCLKPGGKWLYVTFRQPHFLRSLLQRENIWTETVETLGGQDGTFEYFGWIMEKKEG